MTSQTIDTHILEELEREPNLELDRYKIFFKYLLDKLSRGNRLHLYSLFSKLSYLDGILGFADSELRAFHYVRRCIENGSTALDDKLKKAFEFSVRRFLSLILTNQDIDCKWEDALKTWEGVDPFAHKVVDRKDFIRAAIVHVDVDHWRVQIVDDDAGKRLTALFNIAEVNEMFNTSIKHLGTRIQLPIVAHFLDNRFVSETEFIPAAVIVDPDFLVDVTAIAECFTPTSEVPLAHLLKQLLPKSSSPHLLLGNIANIILDRFMLGKKLQYNELMTEVFRQFAVEFSLLSDEEVLMVSRQSKQLLIHLYHDVRILKEESQEDIAYIEPAFISNKYGIQGRLDTLFFKCGLPFR